uniref:Uncharacterized protein n=1 Tax=Meloidogyne floridensis TaxID=298350 RepID=A0A915P0X6_9BILA
MRRSIESLINQNSHDEKHTTIQTSLDLVLNENLFEIKDYTEVGKLTTIQETTGTTKEPTTKVTTEASGMKSSIVILIIIVVIVLILVIIGLVYYFIQKATEEKVEVAVDKKKEMSTNIGETSVGTSTDKKTSAAFGSPQTKFGRGNVGDQEKKKTLGTETVFSKTHLKNSTNHEHKAASLQTNKFKLQEDAVSLQPNFFKYFFDVGDGATEPCLSNERHSTVETSFDLLLNENLFGIEDCNSKLALSCSKKENIRKPEEWEI